MPNPKAGTVSPNITQVQWKFYRLLYVLTLLLVVFSPICLVIVTLSERWVTVHLPSLILGELLFYPRSMQ